MKKEKQRIINFLNSIDWMFQTNNFDKELIWQKEDKDNIQAEIIIIEKYQKLEVYIYPRFFKEKLESQRKILLHELCHILTDKQKSCSWDLLSGKLKTFDEIKHINEQSTSQIENILDGLLQGRLTYAKKAFNKYLI